MGKLIKGTLATALTFEPMTFSPIKVSVKVLEAGSHVASGPNKGKKRSDNVAVVKGKIDGKSWGTAIQVGQLAQAQADGTGTFFAEKSFIIEGDEYIGELLDEFNLGSLEGKWFGSN